MSDIETYLSDPIAVKLRTYAQNIFVIIFGLLPLFFIPSTLVPFEYTKALVVVLGVCIALILYSLSVLRSGVIGVGVSYPLCALWAAVGVAFISSLLSGDFKDSLIGDLFSIHATIFLALLALVPTMWVLLRANKGAVMRMYILLGISTLFLVVFHAVRIAFGPDVLAFGLFTGNSSTPVGSWNDLALFLGLTTILSLVALEQLTLTKIGKILFAGVTVLSLGMLGVINFFIVWVVVGITSLVMIVYTLGKNRFSETQLPQISTNATNTASLGTALLVFICSVLFIVGGSTFGGFVSKYTQINYVEVRPSFEATADIAREVYRENAFLGIGPNKFTDAWRLYKADAINSTPFWNTDFNAGSGFITTLFVTTGVFGGIAWAVFLVTYFVTGLRRLFGSTTGDKIWYFIGVSSFVSSMYIWGMSIVYVPGVVILLIGALCTGISLHAFSVLSGRENKYILIGKNLRSGFALTLAVIVVIIVSVSALYSIGRHYSAVYAFNQSVLSMQQGKGIADLENEVVTAYELSTSDVFARRIAEYQLARMNTLVVVENPTEAQQAEFQQASVTGVNAAQEAINIDAQEPANWATLGGIYAVLAMVGIEGAQERAIEALTKSRELNPKNPLPYLESAIVEARAGNYEQSRGYIQNAIALKPNFTEAFYLLSQLEIANGNVQAAIDSTKATITLEPQNAARYYQLGILETSQKNVAGAVAAFEQAVLIDQNYANARYLLALGYDELGKHEEAKAQLEAILVLNPGNTDVSTLIQVLNQEGSLARLRTNAQGIVNEATPVTNDNGTVSTTQETETPLVNPVNTSPKVDATEEVTP